MEENLSSLKSDLLMKSINLQHVHLNGVAALKYQLAAIVSLLLMVSTKGRNPSKMNASRCYINSNIGIFNQFSQMAAGLICSCNSQQGTPATSTSLFNLMSQCKYSNTAAATCSVWHLIKFIRTDVTDNYSITTAFLYIPPKRAQTPSMI